MKKSNIKIRKLSSYLILLSIFFLMSLIIHSQFQIEINSLPNKIKEIMALPVYSLTLIFLSLFVGIFGYFNHEKLDFGEGKNEKSNYFHNFFKFIFIITSAFCFALGLAAIIIILRLVDSGGLVSNAGTITSSSSPSGLTTKSGIGDLISASGFILAVVSAYYLWALARAEAEAKRLTSEMQNMISKVEKIAEQNERRLNSNSNSLSHLYYISLKANANIINIIKKNTSIAEDSYDGKNIKWHLDKIQVLQKVLYFIDLISRPIKNENARIILNSYKENIQTIKQESASTIVEWEAIAPLLESFMRQLRMMFPRKNEYSKDIWLLIEAICHDLGVDPDNL